MERIKNVKTTAKERKIDEFVKEEAFDDTAWDDELETHQKSKPTSIRLSGFPATPRTYSKK